MKRDKLLYSALNRCKYEFSVRLTSQLNTFSEPGWEEPRLLVPIKLTSPLRMFCEEIFSSHQIDSTRFWFGDLEVSHFFHAWPEPLRWLHLTFSEKKRGSPYPLAWDEKG